MFLIESKLYQGGVPLFEDLPSDISAVVSLLDRETYVPFAPLLNSWPNIQVAVWMPLIDGFPFPGVAWLKRNVSIIENLDQAGHCLFIHCSAGVSRSVMMTAAFLMKKYFWSADKALELISKTNKKLNPNKSFLEGLKEWHFFLMKE